MTEPTFGATDPLDPTLAPVVVPATGFRRRIAPVHLATAGSLLTGVIGQATLLVSGVLAARMLGPELRGHLALFILVPVALTFIGTIGLPLAGTYYLAYAPGRDRSVIRLLLRAALVQTTALLIIHSLVLFALYRGADDNVQFAAILSLAAVPGTVALQFGQAILQGRRLFKAFNLCRLLPSALYSVAVITAFATNSHDLALLTLCWSGAYLIAGILTLGSAVRSLPPVNPSVEAPDLREMVPFGLRAFVGSASPVEMFSVDQAVVGLFVSPAALGVYVVANAFTNLPRFLAQSIGLVAYPTVAATVGRTSRLATLWRFFWVTVFLCTGTVVALELLVSTLVPFFYGPDFEDAVPLARTLLLAAVFLGGRRVLADGARGAGQPLLGTLAEATSWLGLLVLLPVLVPLFGANGVAVAVVLSSAISFVFLIIALAVPSLDHSGQRSSRSNARRAPAHRAKWSLSVVGVVMAAAAGVTLPFLSQGVALLLITGSLLLGLVLATRRLFGRLLRSLRARPLESPRSLPVDNRFRHARIPYYIGLLFVGQLSFRPVLNLTFSDCLFLVALFVVLLEVFLSHSGRFPRLRPSSLLYGSTLFLLGVLVTAISLEYPGATLTLGLRFFYVTLVWFWLGTVVLRDVRHVKRAIYLWIASVGVSGFAAMVQLFFGDVVPGTSPLFGRMTGTAVHVNDLGGMTGVALAAGAALASIRGVSRRGRWPTYALLLFVVAGCVVSGSVGGMLAGTVGLAAWVAASHIRARVVVVAGVALVGGFLLVAAQEEAGAPTPFERAAQVTSSEDDPAATLWSRMDTNRAAIARIAADPIVGKGLGEPTSTGFQVHNFLLGPWFEAGLFAVAGMLVILFTVWSTGLQAVRCSRSLPEWRLATGLLSAFAAFVAFGMGAPILFQRYGWAPAALIVALRTHQLRSSRTRSDVSPALLVGESLSKEGAA